MKPLCNFVPDEAKRSRQPLHRASRFILIPVYSDENPRGSRVFCERNLANAHQPDAWIAKFTLNNRFNFLAQGFSETLAMIFLPAPLHDHSPD